jgi:hypothetical protein
MTTLKPLSPERWRVLNTLFHSSLHTVRPTLTAVSKGQDVTVEDIDALVEARHVTAYLGDEEVAPDIGLHKLSNHIQRHIRLRLSVPGKAMVINDPGNQIRYTLGQHNGSITLARLYDGNTITLNDVAVQQDTSLITVELSGVGEIEVSSNAFFVKMFTGEFTVTLTAKGRKYIPY